VVIVAVNADNLRSVHLRAQHLGLLQVRGNNNAGAEAECAACAATALAKLPVEEQLTISKPKFRAWESATATTRSLKLSVGKHTASFLR